jgi:MFS transporter, ACS family, DAL5 transporter family protein
MTSPSNDQREHSPTGSAAPSVMGNEKMDVSHINDKMDLEGADQELPSVLAPIEALGIEDWRTLEKKIVRRLDLTLMPCLWVCCLFLPTCLRPLTCHSQVLYIFNYLDRASIA